MTALERYKSWLAAPWLDEASKKELADLTDEKEIEDRFYREMEFGTAGMRGVLAAGLNRMNVYTVRRATQGLADYICACGEEAKKRGVAIAYDSRRNSELFARETACVLCAAGVKVYLYESLRPVPQLSFALRYLHCISGVVITASHNPAQYNGYKVYWEDGAQLPPERADEVLAMIRAHDYADCEPMDEQAALASGLLEYVPAAVDDAYIAQVKTLAIRPELLRKHGSELKIVYTPLHGSGNLPVRRVLKEMGVTNLLVVREQEAPDGNFPTVKVPNPENADTFAMAIELANREGADCCFATDPDCDRLGVATRKPDGSFALLTGNQIGCLLLNYICESLSEMGRLPKNGAAIKSIVSTELARSIAESYGVAMIDVLTGFKFIAEQIQHFEETGEHTFLFGFEESYGFLSSTFVRDKDAVNASLLVTELALYLRTQGRTLWDELQRVFEKYGHSVEHVSSVVLPGKDGVAKMKQIMQDMRACAPKAIAGLPVLAVRDYKTGLRTDAQGVVSQMGLPVSDVLYYELEGKNWVCVRPSGTEPKIKLYVNTRAASSEAALELNAALEKAAQALLQ